METRNGRPLRANRGKNPNARWIVEEPVSKPKRRKSSGSKPPKPKEEPITEGETRCQCNGGVSDDKTMAECENCSTWQHVICEFGVDDESALPEPYHCFRCREKDEEDEETSSKENGNGTVKGESSGEENEATSGIESLKDRTRKSVAESFLHVLESISKDSQEDRALALESALFAAFAKSGCVTPAYREQFRTLSFNLKDEKNTSLRDSVVSGELGPEEFVKMSSRDLQNPELRKMTQNIQEESLREAIIKEDEPPLEVVNTNTAEVNVEPSHVALDREDVRDEQEQDEAMKEPLGPPPVPTDELSKPSKEAPVWTGPVHLADDSIAFDAEALRVGQQRDWPNTLGTEVVIRGLVQADRALEYFTNSAAAYEHELGAVAIVSKDRSKLCELYDYVHSRERVGSIQTARPDVKDAFLVPWDGQKLPYLELDTESMELLQHLRIEHDNGKLLLALYVFNKI